MTKSRSVGPIRVRPQIKAGVETGKWFVDIPEALTSDGKRKRRLFDNQRQANDVARELRRHIDPVKGVIRVRSSGSSITVADAVDGWARDEELRVQTLKKRPHSLKIEKYKLRRIKALHGDRKLDFLSVIELTKYQALRLKEGFKPVSINSEIATICLVLKWAVKQGLLKEFEKPEQIPVRPASAVIPTPEEVVRIIHELPAHLKPIIRFMAETGCRRGEAINLTWDCVDEIGGYAEIKAKDGWTPKTQQSERQLPLNPDLLEMIRSLPKEGLYVFPGNDPDSPLGEFKRSWTTAVKKAAITRRGEPVHIPVKNLRKANATWQAERGVNESVLQGLLGHARGSRVTRRYYVHVSEEAKREAVVTLPFAANASENVS